MENPFLFYGKFLSLLGVLSAIVSFNYLTWGFHRQQRPSVWYVENAQPERGPALLKSYGCNSCHTVPGNLARRTVGPRLDQVRDQVYLAGVLPNMPANLIRWVRNPQAIRPHTAMPNLGVSEQDARDIAAYLYHPDLYHPEQTGASGENR